MVSQTNELALEVLIQRALTGTDIEALRKSPPQVAEASPSYASPLGTQHQGYVVGLPENFNAQYALDETVLWDFLQRTQAKELATFKKHNAIDWQRKWLERFDRMIKKHGVLHLLKKGLSVDACHFHLLYPLPLASSSETIQKQYQANHFSCMRQVRYSQANPRQEIDMVLLVNGIPIITLELKNHWTGQTARYNGQKQYREDRDTRQPLLQFGRCLVHMAVDTDEVYMTTKLAEKNTFFLPFNKGHDFGEGNPPNPSGHKTAYLWEQIFTRESLSNIIQHFVRLDGSSKDPLNKRTLFFPRYHQLDVVRKLVQHVSAHGTNHTYLIQHSAGSGKSNSITWVAFQLIETYPASNEVANGRALNQPVFDSVIVVTDRRLLDKQLRDNIKDFSEVKNIIAPAFSAKQLKENLETGKKVIITTIQKFPFIVDGIANLSDKRFAVIIDEAHSSQSGSAHDKMNAAMGGAAAELEEDDLDKMVKKVAQARKMCGNASYFAFTATPKNTTLEKFGEKQEDGSFKPFHLYSMKQAIQEGFILDVLANYTTYNSYYEITKSISENPAFETKKAQKILRAAVERDQLTIDIKARVMLEHFIPHVVQNKKLKGKGKGMVVTQNIEVAIRYFNAMRKILAEYNHPFKVAIAFSGEKEVDGIEYTESSINGFSDTETKDKFDTDEYRLLVVANKYLTGFDQPKLCAMYVDKKLASVLCVQTLSRLNRSAPKYGKKTEDLFVLDFFNSTADIKTAFDPFYTSTTLSEATDVNVLHELKDALDEEGVYEWFEVEGFVKNYFQNKDSDTLSPFIDTAVSRFDHELGLEEETKIDFKIKAKQFAKIYGQMAAILPYEVIDWEKLFWFLKFLIPKLTVKNPEQDAMDSLMDSVDLSSYGLTRTKLGHSITLDAEESELDPQNPNPRGAHGVDPQTDPLDEIIRNFNERWFQGWSETPEEQRVKFVNIANSVAQHPDFESKFQNNPDPHTRELAFQKIVKDIMLKRRKEDMEFYKLFMKDEAFNTSFMSFLQERVEADLTDN